MSHPLPPHFGLDLDPAAWLEDNALFGGTPFRIVRLRAAHAAALAGWRDGEVVGDGRGLAAFARALVATGLAHPRPPHGAVTPSAARVSVVVPVHDRPAQLRRLLTAIRACQVTDPVHEVIVVDDASSDAHAHADAVADVDVDAKLVRRETRGRAPAARNDGAAIATGEVIAFVDSDCVPRSGWLSALLPHFADPLVAAVAPRIVDHDDSASAGHDSRGWLSRYEAVRSRLDRGPTPARVIPAAGRVPFVPAATLLVRAAALGPGFDETLHGGEDVELVWRLTRQGRHVRYEPAGFVEHDHRVDASGFLSRRAYYGRTAAPLARRHPGFSRPLTLSPWTVTAWVAAALRRPGSASVVTGVSAALLARQLRNVAANPARRAVELAGGGTLRSGTSIAAAISGAWWPASMAAWALAPRLRPALLAAAVVPPLLEWRRERPDLDPVRWLIARRLDEGAYGWGMWSGCVRERDVDVLRPDLGWRLRIETSDELIADAG